MKMHNIKLLFGHHFLNGRSEMQRNRDAGYRITGRDGERSADTDKMLTEIIH